jgi:hypothetical protein
LAKHKQPMSRTELIALIRSDDSFYQNISLDHLSNDDLLVIKFSIEANSKLMKGVVKKRILEFQKHKQALFIK